MEGASELAASGEQRLSGTERVQLPIQRTLERAVGETGPLGSCWSKMVKEMFRERAHWEGSRGGTGA